MPNVNISSLIATATKSERVKVGSHYEDNPERKGFFGFFKFWKPKRVEVSDYENREYVDAGDVADKFFAPFQKELFTNQKSTADYARGQAANIKAAFSKRFEELDKLLKDKLNALEACANDEKNVDAILAEAQARLAWLENIDKKIKEILDI